ncbi:hypothetical protein HY570_03660 [Candidatus Micrarchaeota archaeon]|nr:hypothetical protein [Candidatus Micrarchaeota archaeon]
MSSEEKERTLEELKKRKEDLIGQIRSIRSLIANKSMEVKALDTVLAQKDGNLPRSYQIRKEIEQLEFRIATEATSLKTEKALIKELRELERHCKQAEEIDRLRRTKMSALNAIRNEESKLDAISKEIDEINAEMSGTYQEISDERREQYYKEKEKRKRQEKDDRMKKELDSYSNKFGGLTLGDICIIKKKNS